MQPDTLIPDLYDPQSWNRYSYVQGNPIGYRDSTGHYKENVHYALTFTLVYQAAFAIAQSRGYSDVQAEKLATSFAVDIASADKAVDSNESPLLRPGSYADCDLKGCRTYTIGTARHRYTTTQAEDELKTANTREEFGTALHAYQDSYSHWKKLGEPNTPGEIWDRHARNQVVSGVCTIKSVCIDTFDSTQDSAYGKIDADMQTGSGKYINDYLSHKIKRVTPYHPVEAE